MSARPRTAAERLERLRRDQEAYRRTSLARRSHDRFLRDLAILPHQFLLSGHVHMAPLELSREDVQLALRGEAVWTLDTAARLLTGHGFLASRDLTCYLSEESFARAVREGLVGAPLGGGFSVAPLYLRPPMLIARPMDPPPLFTTLASGDQVVTWSFLLRDMVGTLGWRPDLLNRLESQRPAEPDQLPLPPPAGNSTEPPYQGD